MDYETKSKKYIYQNVNYILTNKGITKDSIFNPDKNIKYLDKSTFRQMYRPDGVDSKLSTIMHFCAASGISLEDFFSKYIIFNE